MDWKKLHQANKEMQLTVKLQTVTRSTMRTTLVWGLGSYQHWYSLKDLINTVNTEKMNSKCPRRGQGSVGEPAKYLTIRANTGV